MLLLWITNHDEKGFIYTTEGIGRVAQLLLYAMCATFKKGQQNEHFQVLQSNDNLIRLKVFWTLPLK